MPATLSTSPRAHYGITAVEADWRGGRGGGGGGVPGVGATGGGGGWRGGGGGAGGGGGGRGPRAPSPQSGGGEPGAGRELSRSGAAHACRVVAATPPPAPTRRPVTRALD